MATLEVHHTDSLSVAERIIWGKEVPRLGGIALYDVTENQWLISSAEEDEERGDALIHADLCAGDAHPDLFGRVQFMGSQPFGENMRVSIYPEELGKWLSLPVSRVAKPN